MKKKLLSVLLTVVMVLSLIPAAVYADGAVAQIGNAEYDTLADAVAAAEDGATITLIGNETLASTVTITKNLTIDFAGHTLTAARQALVVSGNYDLTVDDSVGNGGITVSASSNYQGCIQALGGGTLTIEGGTFTASRSGSTSGWVYNIYVKEGSSLVMNGGEIVVPSASTVDYNYGIYVDGTGNVTMTGGRITMNASGGNYGIYAGGSGAVVMSGGYIDGTSYFRFSGFRMFYPQGISLTGSGTVAVSGGYISAPDGRAIDNEGKESRVEITGGCFTLDAYWIDSIKSGYERINNPDSETSATYPVAVVPKAAARIGTARYATLEAAVAAAQSGDTITLLADVTYDEDHVVAVWEKDFDLDLNGHTFTTNSTKDITASNNGYKATAICYGDTVVANPRREISVSNGTIHTAYGAGIYVDGDVIMTLSDLGVRQNYPDNVQTTDEYSAAIRLTTNATVIVESGSYYGKNAIAVSNSGGTVVVNGGTFTGDVFFSSSTSSGAAKAITINGGSFTNVHFVNTNKGTLTITGGTFDADPSDYVPAGYEVVNNGNGTWTVGTVKVAQIGTTKYESLADAIAAVPTNGTATTITMIGDETVSSVGTGWVTIADGKNIVLDLNGHTISGASTEKSTYFIKNYGTLEIKDSGENGKITLNAVPDWGYSKESVTIYNLDGVLTLTGGKIENTTPGGASYAINNSSNAWGKGDDKETVFIMNGGIVSAPQGDAALRVYQNCAQNPNPFSHNTVTINGGTILDTGIFVDNNVYQGTAQTTGEGIVINITINGGTVNGLIDLKLRHAFNTSLTINGGDFNEAKLRVRKKTESTSIWNVQGEPTEPIVRISGGRFSFVAPINMFNTSDGWTTTSSWSTYETPIEVTGGKFNLEPTFVADGYKAVNNTGDDATAYPHVIGKATNYVAQIGETKYDTLAAAVAAANADTSGEAITITLLADLDFSDEAYAGYKWAGATYNPLAVTRSNVTIDLGGYTISNMGNAAIVLGNLLAADGRIENVTIKNGTLRAGQTNNVTNSYVLGIAGVDGALVKNITTSGGINVYSAAKDVVIDSCNVTGTKYYTVCAQVGSDVTIKGTTYTKNTDNTVDSKAMFWVHGAGTESDIATDANPTGAHGASTIVIESGSFTVDFTNGGVFKLGSGLNPVVKGGTFNFDPSAYVAEGYEAVDNNNGTWTVGKVKASEIQQAAEATQGYEATYTASKSVVNAQDETDVLKNEVPVTVNVKIEATTDTATAANAANDVAISKVDVEKVVNKAVEVAETTANTINVKIDVVRDKDVAVTVVNAVPTVTFEVHPVATVFVDEEEVGSVVLTNDDLKDDASFEITLPVDDAIVAATTDNKIQVTHKGESSDEVFTCDVQGTAGNYFVTFTVTHFSAFELAPVSVVAPGDRADCVCTLELTDGFILNFYVDNLKNEYGIAETDVSKYSVRYTYHDVTKTVALSSVTKGAYGYKIPVAYCAAKELCDQVTIDLLYEGETFRSTITYSAKQYCDYMISVGDATTVALCQKILQYGAYAQYRFHYNEGNLADSNINSWEYPDVVIDSDYNKAGYQNTSWGGVSGASLSLEARTEINIYFYVSDPYADESNYYATVNDQAATVINAGDGTFCVTIKGIMATDLDDVYHVAITSGYAGDEGELTIDFSALTYACWMYDDGNEQQEWGVCRALFEYYQAVQAYLAAH